MAEKAEAERVARIAAQKIELDKAKAERMAAMAAAVAEKEKSEAEQRAVETAEEAKRMGAERAEADRLAPQQLSHFGELCHRHQLLF